MALDKSFSHTSHAEGNRDAPDQGALHRFARLVANRPVLLHADRCLSDPGINEVCLGTVARRLCGKDGAVFIPALDQGKLLAILERVCRIAGDLRPSLYRSGILTIRPAVAIGNSLVLSGGSYSTVTLHIRDEKPVVSKRIRKQYRRGDVDADIRLQAEASWLAALPLQAASLFPRLLSLYDGADECVYEMEFVPMPTVAELVFHNCLDADGISDALVQAYTALRSSLYSLPRPQTNELEPAPNYLDRIERRTAAILSSGHVSGDSLRELYGARRVVVNGLDCPTLTFLVDHLRCDELWAPVIYPNNVLMCHGDLILEDILLDASGSGEVRLVDPNPFNTSVLFDIAKTLLSLLIGYEFLYYDLFEIKHSCVERSGTFEAQITFGRPDCQQQYAIAARRFIAYIREQLQPYLGLKDDGLFEAQLRMAAALQASAIPMFHLLHHKQEARALAFACLGLYHAAHALHTVGYNTFTG